MVSNTVQAHTERRHTLIQINQRVHGDDKTAADGLFDSQHLRTIEWQTSHGPNNRMHTLLNVERNGDHCTCVRTHGNTTKTEHNRL